jgi:hypothetical protein
MFSIKKIRNFLETRTTTQARVRKRTRRLQNEQSKKEDEESIRACRAVPEEAKGQTPLMGTFNPHFLSFFFFSATFVVFR